VDAVSFCRAQVAAEGKKDMKRPAVLGGRPAFPRDLPFNLPTLPDPDRLTGKIKTVLKSGVLTKGPVAERLEAKAQKLLGVKHVVAVSSCTAGLMLVLRTLDVRGEVVLPSFTFSATGHAVVWNGCTPVFAEVDERRWVIDASDAAKRITKRTSAIVATHVFGAPAPVSKLESIAKSSGVPLVLDAAHALGSSLDGRPLGGRGAAEVFSLSPTKLITSGEGGLVATNDSSLARLLRMGRDYGNPGNYDCRFVGLNARMSEINAVVGLATIATLGRLASSRRRIAARYREKLATTPGLSWQQITKEGVSSYKDVVAAVDRRAFGLTRDQLARALQAEGIPTRPYFHPPLHRQRAFSAWAPPRGTLSRTERIASRTLALPIWSHMRDSAIDRVALAIRRIHEHADDVRARLRSVR
jgi:dTDP-4-amino-4,6-dideoxygalactose transaminase